MKESKLNKILPLCMRTASTVVDSLSIQEAGISNLGFRHKIRDILDSFNYNKEDCPMNSGVSKFSSDSEKGYVFCKHNCDKIGNMQPSYGLSYLGIKRDVIENIEKEIINTNYLRILE